MSHAKAPWKTGPVNYADVYDADGNVIALIPKGFDWTVDTARLITAAPDLLAALKLIWSMFDDGRIVRNIANDGEPDWALKMLNFTRELQSIQKAIAKAEIAAKVPA